MADPAPLTGLSRNEAIALGVAVAGHVALGAALIFSEPADPPSPPAGRMAVSLVSDSGEISTAPDPQLEAAPDAGPELGDMDPPPEPEPIPLAKALTPPRPAVVPSPQVRAQTPPAKPAAKPPVRKPPVPNPPRPGTKAGRSSFDDAFRDGIPGGTKGPNKNPPAQASGAQKSSWTSLIGNRVKGPWNGCKVSGLDIEQLYVDVSFVLAPDGGILSMGDPLVGGITAANRAQVAPFKACAVRAIRLAAPFTGLPPEFYNDWKSRKLRLRKREQ